MNARAYKIKGVKSDYKWKCGACNQPFIKKAFADACCTGTFPKPRHGTCGICGKNHSPMEKGGPTCIPQIHSTPVQKQQVGGTHYLKKVQPWDLMKCMDTSGNAFVDACRCNVIKYAFRKKTAMVEDLKKARHYLDAAIAELEASNG